ncbi:hypothetical protein IFM89_007379 [Coptis chinensis]|uniref:Cullin family profile domain-containing protein n=1 Tax=Coptis chinensis TaxID=261450 RepID=A0A835M7S0_9MAGN|nr:hypothetical protein IFM89_007379 [Coptis chinensis]
MVSYPVVYIVEDENIEDRGLGLENLVDACYGVHEVVHIEDSDRPQASFPPENVEQSLHREYPRQNRSTCRDFPAGCGRRALLDPVDEYQELIECYQDRRVGEKSSEKNRLDQLDSQPTQKDFVKISFKRSRESTLSPSYAKSSYFSNNDEKMRMKPANLNNKKSVRRNVFGKSVYESALIQISRNMTSSSTTFNWGDTVKSNQVDPSLPVSRLGKLFVCSKLVFRKLMRGVEANRSWIPVKKLARRLLFGTSVSDDHERSILAKLNQQFSGQFTSKMEGMVTDLALAREQ